MEYTYIVKTPGTCGGRPRIDGSRIAVDMIVQAVIHHKETPEEYQRTHPHLTLAQVYAALTYYYDHQEEIEGIIQQGKEIEQEVRKKFPSRLQEKWKKPEEAKP